MAPEAASRRGDDTDMKLLCSHGGRFQPCGPDGEPRYVGGETRVLVVPRAVSFRDLVVRLAEMAGGSVEEVRAIRHRLADEDVIVSATCDQEVAHMRDEYDRLRATRPAARFRVFVTSTASSSAGSKRATTAGHLPPLAPSMRRVQSEQAIAARAPQQHRPTRRVHSAQELAGGVHMQPSFHHQRHQHCCCSCHRRDRYTPARPTYAAVQHCPTSTCPGGSRSVCVRGGGGMAGGGGFHRNSSREGEEGDEQRRRGGRGEQKSVIWELE